MKNFIMALIPLIFPNQPKTQLIFIYRSPGILSNSKSVLKFIVFLMWSGKTPCKLNLCLEAWYGSTEVVD